MQIKVDWLETVWNFKNLALSLKRSHENLKYGFGGIGTKKPLSENILSNSSENVTKHIKKRLSFNDSEI